MMKMRSAELFWLTLFLVAVVTVSASGKKKPSEHQGRKTKKMAETLAAPARLPIEFPAARKPKTNHGKSIRLPNGKFSPPTLPFGPGKTKKSVSASGKKKPSEYQGRKTKKIAETLAAPARPPKVPAARKPRNDRDTRPRPPNGKVSGRGKTEKKIKIAGQDVYDRSIVFLNENPLKTKEFGEKACQVNINKQLGADPQPLYFYPDGQFVEITNSYGIFYIEKGEGISIFCEDGFNQRQGRRVDATCVKENRFRTGNVEFEIGSLNCKRRMLGAMRRVTNQDNTCLNGRGEMAEIGFNFDGDWKPLFEVCHNPALASAEWTHYIIDPMHIGFQKSFCSAREGLDFLLGTSDFYTGITKIPGEGTKVEVDLWYTRKRQIETFSKILPGGKANAEQLMTNERSLDRGHLIAKADLIFGAHQLATFFFINVAPQWHAFNAGNWRILEKELKDFVKWLDHRAEVYTGTHGVMKYKGVELFLYVDEHNRIKKLPVPRIFYKIIVVKSLKQAIVIIGINNPMVTREELQGEYNYCTDISREKKVGPLRKIIPNNKEKGLMMACTIQDFLSNKRIKDKHEHPYIAHWADYGVLVS